VGLGLIPFGLSIKSVLIFFVPRANKLFLTNHQSPTIFLSNSLNYISYFNWYEIEARKLQKEFIENKNFSSNSKELLKAKY